MMRRILIFAVLLSSLAVVAQAKEDKVATARGFLSYIDARTKQADAIQSSLLNGGVLIFSPVEIRALNSPGKRVLYKMALNKSQRIWVDNFVKKDKTKKQLLKNAILHGDTLVFALKVQTKESKYQIKLDKDQVKMLQDHLSLMNAQAKAYTDSLVLLFK